MIVDFVVQNKIEFFYELWRYIGFREFNELPMGDAVGSSRQHFVIRPSAAG